MAAPKNLPGQNPVFSRMKRQNRVDDAMPAPAEVPPAPTEDLPPVQPAPSPVTTLPTPATPPVQSQSPKPAPVAGHQATLTIFFTAQTRAAFRAKAKRLRLTKPVALMTAVEDSYEDLPTLLGGGQPERKVRLFELPASSRRDAEEERRDASESMKLSEHNIAVLDQLKDQLGAKSRNDLLNVAVGHWVRDEITAK